jgi:ABC-type bacteriocin/lantibiotic exporter with double-glycine peptidase domain
MSHSRRTREVVCLLGFLLSGLSLGYADDTDPLCGVNCLYTALVALEKDPGTFDSFLQRFEDIQVRGIALGRLAEVAEDFGLSTLAVQTTLEGLALRDDERPFVCIAHVENQHFVLIADVQPGSVWVVNPPEREVVAEKLFQERWSGHALLLSTRPQRREEALSRRSQWPIVQIVVLSLGVLVAGGFVIRRLRQVP